MVKEEAEGGEERDELVNASLHAGIERVSKAPGENLQQGHRVSVNNTTVSII